MNKYWPNVKESPSDSGYTQFWQHEWTKHGTCSGFTQKEYFQTAIDNFVTSPSILADAYGKTISKSDLISAYGAVVSPICKGKMLSEVLICKDMKTLKNMDCVKSVINEGNCPNTISVPAFD
jgi:ribonuclease T2